MLVYYAAITAPFFFAGLCMSVALSTFSRQVSRVYFFDLAGAGMGCLLVVFVMSAVSPPGAVVVAAVALSAAGVLFAAPRGGRAVVVPAVGTLVVAALGVAAFLTLSILPSPEKFLYPFLSKPGAAADPGHRWSAIFRTDHLKAVDEDSTRALSYATWGTSPKWKPLAATRAPKIRFITHDGDAGAVVYNFDGDLDKLEMFDHSVLKTPYLLLDRPNVLVIGVGGGTDIVNAIKNRANHVTGVELDPFTVELIATTHADFAGHIYDRPDVTMIVGEGRSTVRHSGAKYDLIQLSGVDTLVRALHRRLRARRELPLHGGGHGRVPRPPRAGRRALDDLCGLRPANGVPSSLDAPARSVHRCAGAAWHRGRRATHLGDRILGGRPAGVDPRASRRRSPSRRRNAYGSSRRRRASRRGRSRAFLSTPRTRATCARRRKTARTSSRAIR